MIVEDRAGRDPLGHVWGGPERGAFDEVGMRGGEGAGVEGHMGG